MNAAWVGLVFVVLMFVVVFYVLLRYPGEVRGLIGRVRQFSMSAEGGLSFELYEEAVAKKEDRPPAPVELEREWAALTRVRMLWVDDEPANNRLEIKAFRARGLDVDVATSNVEALGYARARTYQVVISDIGRALDESGLELPSLLREAGVATPIVFYVGTASKPTTSDGHPVADTPSALLREVLRALGRDDET